MGVSSAAVKQEFRDCSFPCLRGGYVDSPGKVLLKMPRNVLAGGKLP
jgi:hypothetical protein